jgi:hypothetical protein
MHHRRTPDLLLDDRFFCELEDFLAPACADPSPAAKSRWLLRLGCSDCRGLRISPQNSNAHATDQSNRRVARSTSVSKFEKKDCKGKPTTIVSFQQTSDAKLTQKVPTVMLVQPTTWRKSMEFDWMYAGGHRTNTDAWRNQYTRDIRERAKLLCNLKYSRERATQRIQDNLNWEFDSTIPSTPTPTFYKEVTLIVASVYDHYSGQARTARKTKSKGKKKGQ